MAGSEQCTKLLMWVGGEGVENHLADTETALGMPRAQCDGWPTKGRDSGRSLKGLCPFPAQEPER